MAGFPTEFKGDAIMLGVGPVKIMILEGRFLLTNFLIQQLLSLNPFIWH